MRAIIRRLLAPLATLMLAVPAAAQAPAPLDPLTQPQFVNPLPRPAVATPLPVSQWVDGVETYEVKMTELSQDLGIYDPVTGAPLMTTVWGYGGSYPGPTIEARTGTPIKVRWVNDLPDTHLLPVDPTLTGGEDASGNPVLVGALFPQSRAVTHLHGGHVPDDSDGNPMEWVYPGDTTLDDYPNDQAAATLWYHDHAMGITRLNVYAGLAGFYLIRDDAEDALNLPSGDYEVPLVIQDRMFRADGSLDYPATPIIDPGTGNEAPSVEPEFFGNVILVNGKAWPFLNVEPRLYRFRILNGSNSRFYDLFLSSGTTMWQIGSDGGLLAAPVAQTRILLAPAERADVLVDFSGLQGQTIIVRNTAKGPYPNGLRPDPRTTGRIMAFRVANVAGGGPAAIPASLTTITPLTGEVRTRVINLVEGVDNLGRLQLLIDNKTFMDAATETPTVGDTEIWTIVNGTPDTHPIHLHLVEFQLLDRQKFDPKVYAATGTLKLRGQPKGPRPGEGGWKDTVQMDPGEVTRIIAHFDLAGRYVWHCHILEHEDHEMMRPLVVKPAGP